MPHKLHRIFVQIAVMGALFSCACSLLAAQDDAKPLDPNDPRLTFSFPIKKGGSPMQFKVNLDKSGAITGVSVLRSGQTEPFQTLPACENLLGQVDEGWEDYELSKLVTHADFNFDGFEDLELLQYYDEHLDKKLYCIFLWDDKAGRFAYSSELTEISTNLETHPENKTLTASEDWQGGAFQNSTYRWNSGKLELIEQDSLLGDWGLTPDKGKCAFEFTCSRLINGKMTKTLGKNICTQEEMDNLPNCPAAGASVTPGKIPPPPAKNGKN